MKTIPSLLCALCATTLLTLTATPSLRAQSETTTTTTTTTVDPNNPEAVTKTTKTTVTTTGEPAPLPGQHVAEIELVVAEGSVQAYFGRAARGEKVEIGSVDINIKLPSTATVTKLAERDGDSDGAHKVTRNNPWHVTVPFDGPGRFVFNISDWDDAVVTACVVKVDGQVVFSGHGGKDEFKNWVQTEYAEGVKRTGDREIAFLVGPNR